MELFIFIVSALLLVNICPIILSTILYDEVYPIDSRWKMFGWAHLWQIGVLAFSVLLYGLLVIIKISAMAVFG